MNRFDNNEGLGATAGEVLGRGKKYAGIAAVGTVAALTAWSSVFTVDPTDVAFVRHFSGSVEKTPYRNDGLHLKLPFLDTVDRAQISQRVLNVPEFVVTTPDNQPITIGMNIVVDTPVASAYHLLYEVGKTGSSDIDSNIVPTAKDVVGRILSKQNTTTISQNREAVQGLITVELSKTLKELFGMNLVRMNLPMIDFSPTFKESNAYAVAAKNDAVKAGYEAQQTVTRAKAEADRNIETARGEAQSQVLKAEANLKAAEANAKAAALQGEGEQKRLSSIIASFGSPDKYNQYVLASRWGGSVPNVSVNGSGGNGVSVPVVLPVLPATNGQSSQLAPQPR